MDRIPCGHYRPVAPGSSDRSRPIRRPEQYNRVMSDSSPPPPDSGRRRVEVSDLEGPRHYRVLRRDREPLVRFMVDALEASSCRLLAVSQVDRAPFHLAFETENGERLGILAYAFLANSKPTRNRPADEHRFQLKYGGKKKGEQATVLHRLWQDPLGLQTTLLLGINVERGFWVAADPRMHDPTRFFISIEFKEGHAREIENRGWFSWERDRRGSAASEPVEALLGGRAETFLQLVRFERLALGLDPGHRQLLAEKFLAAEGVEGSLPAPTSTSEPGTLSEPGRAAASHPLLGELALRSGEVLDLIASAPRLKMAVRGWVAEEHLFRQIGELSGIDQCHRLESDGEADLEVVFRGESFLVECKNVLRTRLADGRLRLDFQRTRAAKSDPCSRFYSRRDFHVVAACLHSCVEQWQFLFATTAVLDPHPKCEGKLANLVRLDERWGDDLLAVLETALEARQSGMDVPPHRSRQGRLF